MVGEQTSALDAHAQQKVFDAIDALASAGARRKTVVFITHRLATARRADKVAMMDNGVSATVPARLTSPRGGEGVTAAMVVVVVTAIGGEKARASADGSAADHHRVRDARRAPGAQGEIRCSIRSFCLISNFPAAFAVAATLLHFLDGLLAL